MRGRQSRLAVLAVLASLLLAACASTPAAPTAPRPTPQSPATLAPPASFKTGPKSGGKVTVYSALSDSVNAAIISAFEKAQPVIGLEVLSLAAAGDLEAHVREERSSPKADVVLGGSSEYHDSLGRDGLLEAYSPPGAAAIDAALKDPKGYWTGWYLGILGIMLNTERWQNEAPGRAKPANWDDLLDPTFAGKVVVPDPITTGSGYILLANQVFRYNRDEAKALDFMKRLNQNVAQYTSTAPQAIDRLGKGEFMLGVNWGHDVLTAAANGQPVAFTAPEATAFEVGAVSIVKGAPNSNGARTFVDWVLSREAAEVVVKLSNRISTLKRIEPAPGAPTLESVNLVSYDRTWATENKDRLLAAWRAVVGR